MPMPAYPTIIVPGITASYLLDDYPLTPETIWSVMSRNYERASLHPDNPRFEAVEPARVYAGQVFEIAYQELIEELRHNLRPKVDLPVPVFPFGYDWRQPLADTAARLASFIDEVIERTKLMRHYAKEDYGAAPKVNLVGHSMGGLVITGYLARQGKNHRVHKVATLATPFQGSFEAVIKITTGTADLGVDAPSSREREAARLTPALYSLLPSFTAGIEPAGTNLFQPDTWQTSILDTIEEYVRLHGVSPKDKKKQSSELFASLLNGALSERRLTDQLKLGDIGLTADDWLCVAGVDSKTRVALSVTQGRGGPSFNFRSADRQNKWATGATAAERRETGDGTVPFAGAIPKFLNEENIICVTPDDYGYWEVMDRTISATAGFHGILPNMDMLHRMLVSFLTSQPPKRDNVWGRPAPGIIQPAWPGALKNMRNKDVDRGSAPGKQN
ncbi:MAG: esterase/lipase family protein [Alphaproteobacteria bacterium]